MSKYLKKVTEQARYIQSVFRWSTGRVRASERLRWELLVTRTTRRPERNTVSEHAVG